MENLSYELTSTWILEVVHLPAVACSKLLKDGRRHGSYNFGHGNFYRLFVLPEKTLEGYFRAVVCILMAMSVYKPVAFDTRRSSADSTPSGKMLVNVPPKSYEGIDEDSTFVTCFLFVLFF
jgi:hypothetical protein